MMRACLAVLGCTMLAWAQDTRKVTEPVIPPACVTLKAEIGRAASSIAPENEATLDTRRIQEAIDKCGAGKAVVLRRASARNDAFVSGPLELRKGVTLVVERGAFLYASRNPRDYDREPGVCGTIAGNGRGCKPFIAAIDAAGSGIMGDGVIDGRGGETMLGQNISWWNLSDKARAGGAQNNPRLIHAERTDNFTLYRITLMNSAMFHVGFSNGNGFTAWGVKVWSPERARNTDGIDPGSSTNITIAYCYLHTGDDQVAVKAGGPRHTSNISVLHNHFYSGHGMSIGSETNGGASNIFVSDLSVDGSDIAMRIKSNDTRGGLVKNVTYENVCVRDTDTPIYMDTHYSAHASKAENRIPEFRDITLRNVRVEGTGKVVLEGYDAQRKLGMTFDNVVFDNPERIKVTAKHADLTVGPGPFNLKVQGEDVQITGTAGKGAPNACKDRFPPFPMP